MVKNHEENVISTYASAQDWKIDMCSIKLQEIYNSGVGNEGNSK